MTMDTSQIGNRAWSFAHVRRDYGLGADVDRTINKELLQNTAEERPTYSASDQVLVKEAGR